MAPWTGIPMVWNDQVKFIVTALVIVMKSHHVARRTYLVPCVNLTWEESHGWSVVTNWLLTTYSSDNGTFSAMTTGHPNYVVLWVIDEVTIPGDTAANQHNFDKPSFASAVDWQDYNCQRPGTRYSINNPQVTYLCRRQLSIIFIAVCYILFTAPALDDNLICLYL